MTDGEAQLLEVKMRKTGVVLSFVLILIVLAATGCSKAQTPAASGGLTDGEIENIVRRSYQYVAMYNVINKNAMLYGSMTGTDGWNQCVADTALKDHAYTAIARPNNDTLYTGCMLDLRAEPIIIEYPAFDSSYVSLETSAYDHFVDIPLSTTKGDFEEPTRLLYYTARTLGYSKEPIEGVDAVVEMTGDFAIAFLRAMPHAAEPERMARNVAAMQAVRCLTLSKYQGLETASAQEAEFPAVGQTDFDIFGNNLLEVMQFVFNHTTFDPNNEVDRAVLAAYEPLGVAPGKTYDPDAVPAIDGAKFRQVAEGVWKEEMAKSGVPEWDEKYMQAMFQPKGQISQEALTFQSVLGPIGLPATEAVYPPIPSADGEPMNAMHDYVIRMTADEMPPAGAFWSVTLYDTANGFFIPNDHKKYSVGANAGMKLDDDGGIAIYIAAEKPDGVPEENWLPINREDLEIGPIMRLYEPDLERFASWEVPKAEQL
jgi:hypothetical protein